MLNCKSILTLQNGFLVLDQICKKQFLTFLLFRKIKRQNNFPKIVRFELFLSILENFSTKNANNRNFFTFFQHFFCMLRK